MRTLASVLLVALALALTGCGSGGEPGCTERAQRCNGNVIEVCQGGTFVELTDCAVSGKICQEGAATDQVACVAVPECSAGQSRCQSNRVQTCLGGNYVDQTDCAASGKTCQVDPGTSQAGCISAPECTAGQSRCQGNRVQTCQGGAYVDGQDCAQSGMICEIDPGTSQAGCINAPECTAGQSRCQNDWVQTCQDGVYVGQTDCTLLGQICAEPVGGQPICVVPPCSDGTRRCTGEVLELCAAGVWGAVEDCAARGRQCALGPVSGTWRCLGLNWVHRPVTIQDPVVNGTSLMMAIDNPTFGYDPAADRFITLFDRDTYGDPNVTFLWQYEPGSGIHQKLFLSGQVFPATENFCNGGENWCQFISFDPVDQGWVVAGVSATSIMRVTPAGVASLSPVSGTHPPDSWISHSHRFDWSLRKLLLYGALGPNKFSDAVYELDLDTGAWNKRVSNLPQLADDCLVADAGTGLLYAFGGRLTTDGGDTTQTLASYRVIDLASGQSSTVDLPAAIGPRQLISCALDPARGLVYLLGGSVVNDNWNEILNEYHNDLWILRLSDGAFFAGLADGPLGTFLPPDSSGDRQFDADPALPNFGKNSGLMELDATHDRLVVMGEVPIFNHGQPYTLDLEGVEELLVP